MHLKSIKLAGFKSFVDPTTVQMPSNLNCVVGPNGCGKSNVIDAVRWVMGESSVKHLRGESMADVIFSGSNARAPVGQATVELVFDNSDGTLKGEYGTYNEISIRRTVTRELQSTYYLNGSKCRRRDIQDVFLGTGLGPRSYSIIEQGMISRFIEAKPEELRVYIEEAAGISKYKERRRETENRIRHTKENLERLTDIREELGRQLSHLQRQAKAAEQYSEFKKEERQLQAELMAIRWSGFDTKIKDKDQYIGQVGVQLEAEQAEQRSIEAEIEKQREQHVELNEVFQKVQADFYAVGTEIARYEQSIQHQQERSSQLKEDLVRVLRNWEAAKSDHQNDQQRISQLSGEISEVDPQFEELAAKEQESAAALEAAEQEMQTWQQAWDKFNQESAIPRQQAEVQQSRIQHLEQSIDRIQSRIEKLQQEQHNAHQGDDSELERQQQELETIDERLAENQARMAETMESIEQQREQNRLKNDELSQARRQLQQLQGRYSSLEALQQAALGQKDKPVVEWLEKQQLQKQPRLAQEMKVAKGWERAVEVVLGHTLQAVCVDDLEQAADKVAGLEQGHLTLVGQVNSQANPAAGKTPLADKVDSSWSLSALLAGVYVAETLNDAMLAQSELAAHESIVSKDGVWVGPGWIKLTKEKDEQANVLERQEELAGLKNELDLLDESIEELGVDLDSGMLQLKNLEQSRETAQQELSTMQRQRSDVASQLSAQQARLEQMRLRRERIASELAEHKEHIEQEQEKLQEARQLWQQHLTTIEMDSQRREELQQQRDSKREQLDQIRDEARRNKEQVHQLALRKQSVSTELTALEQGMERLASQVESYAERQRTLEQNLSEAEAPVLELKQQLEEQLEQRVGLETRLQDARREVEGVEQQLQQLEQKRGEAERKIQQVRELLQEQKMQWQGLQVQRETIEQQLAEANQSLAPLLESLPEDAQENVWADNLERIGRRIQRLGPINLAAIDEFKTQSERKTYLDAQNDDLEEASGYVGKRHSENRPGDPHQIQGDLR